MNKKLIAILVLALLIVGGVYMYSAGMLNSLFGISEINGVVFKIPEGYSENNTDINGIHDGYVSKRFSNNGSHISIDVYNNTNNSTKTTTDSNTANSTTTESQQNKTDVNLTDKENKAVDDDIKRNNKALAGKAAGSAGGAAAGSLIFATPEIIRAAKADPEITKMLINNHAELYKSHPDVMIDAQKATYKMEARFNSDKKAALTNAGKVTEIETAQKSLRNKMSAALTNGSPEEIAKTTAEFEAAADRKINGWWVRLKRRFSGKPTRISRIDALNKTIRENKLKVKPAKEGTSFLKNLGGMSCIFSGSIMAAMHVGMDLLSGKIQKAYSVDKETGNKELLQSATAGVISGVVWSLGDALGKTIGKKFLVKAITKFAAKCSGKALGAAIGSIVPGIGTIAGLLIGGLADFAVSKWVMPLIFPSDATTQKTLKNATAEQKLDFVKEQYESGLNASDTTINAMKRKYGEVAFAQSQQLHNLTDKERLALQAAIAQQQQKQQLALSA